MRFPLVFFPGDTCRLGPTQLTGTVAVRYQCQIPMSSSCCCIQQELNHYSIPTFTASTSLGDVTPSNLCSWLQLSFPLVRGCQEPIESRSGALLVASCCLLPGCHISKMNGSGKPKKHAQDMVSQLYSGYPVSLHPSACLYSALPLAQTLGCWSNISCSVGVTRDEQGSVTSAPGKANSCCCLGYNPFPKPLAS